MRVLFLGDVVGRPGRRGVAAVLRRLVPSAGIDFVVANAENASHGKGVTPSAAEELRDAGVDVLTSGNHVWQHREIMPYIAENERLLRPLNFPAGAPGRGWTVRTARNGTPVAVVNLIGRVFMGLADCPFTAVAGALEEIRTQASVIVVDMHGEATSEKVGMAVFLDGRVSAVVGTHTHVQTADERVLPNGTAALTDAGMCGPVDSVLGVRSDVVVQRFLDQLPARFDVAGGPVAVHGAVIDIDERSGRARSVERVREMVES